MQEGYFALLACIRQDAKYVIVHSVLLSLVLCHVLCNLVVIHDLVDDAKNKRLFRLGLLSLNFYCGLFYCIKEFEESGDPERHFQALLSLAKEGVAKGKV